ncbi:hypothetical protein KBY88_13755 [Cyanobium sp. Morenito 9A2]|nr:hypothetical protein [Cyanobium sp. Morenito 9A2]
MRLSRSPFPVRSVLALSSFALVGIGLSACQPSREAQRLQQLEQRVQQLEQRQVTPDNADAADRKGKPPAGVVKSLTFRIGSSDDRLRVYWADGSRTDLPCTKEQGTWACG